MSSPQNFDQDPAPQGQPGQPYQDAPVAQPTKKKKWPWIVGIVGALIVFGAVNGGDSDTTTDARGLSGDTGAAEQADLREQPAPKEAPVAEDVPAPEEQSTDLPIGDTTEVRGMQVTVSNAYFTTDFFGSQYLCIDTALANNSDRQKPFSPYDFELEKPNGVVTDPAIHGLDVQALEYADLNSGGSTSGAVCFDASEPGDYRINYQDGLFNKPVSWRATL